MASASYLQKWIVLGVVIGAVAGAGAIIFYEALVLSTHFFLGTLGGYRVPTPAGEGGFIGSASPARPWALPLIAGGGALIAGILVFCFAPEAEGHGTDAAISAVHHNPRGVRFRAVVVKIIASALTIGSGGSGGREGPTGQISAGFGSLLARVLDLEPLDGRIAVATGVGSGIGAIFSAPLGGAVLAAEILYRDDFEPAALLPCFIASAVSFVVFGAAEGYKPLFGYLGSYHFSDPAQLIWFAIIGVLAGLVGLLYAKSFYGMADLFHRLPWPRWVNPAIGGVLVGAIGIAIPEVLGTGYGWVQKSFGHELLSIPLWIVVLLPLARILATSLSIGSGGSGGIFGPGMVIGAFLGAAVWRVFDSSFPSLGHNPAPYVIVGMMSCFGGISRAPLAVMLMVAEMTGSISILVPAMVAVGLSWLIVRRNDDTIYRSQLKSRADAPAQRILAGLPLLGAISTARAMAKPRLIITGAQRGGRVSTAMDDSGLNGAPLVDGDGRFEGILTRSALQGNERRSVSDLADAGAPTVSADSRLDAALESLIETPLGWVPVLDDERRVVGTLSISDIVRAYRGELATSAERMGELGTTAGAFRVTLDTHTGLTGKVLRHAELPKGLLITSLTRGDQTFVPNGDTVFAAGDHLFVLGHPSDLAALAHGLGPTSS
ncbi:MAG TPA: chloride channel protein [Acidimicrobiales bacterium]|nr:chloride channel protein [Acidimicrobiales bacterium]